MQNIFKYVAVALSISLGIASAQTPVINNNGPVTIKMGDKEDCTTTKTAKPLASNVAHKPATKKPASAKPQPAPAAATSTPATPPADNKLEEMLTTMLAANNKTAADAEKLAAQGYADNAAANNTAQTANAITAEAAKLEAQKDAALAQAALEDAKTRGQLATIEGKRVEGFNRYLHTHGNVEKWDVGAHYAAIAITPWVAKLGRPQINGAGSTIVNSSASAVADPTATATGTGTGNASSSAVAP